MILSMFPSDDNRHKFPYSESQELEALKRQKAAEEQKARETLASELDRLDKEWASKAALKVGSVRPEPESRGLGPVLVGSVPLWGF